MLAALRPGQAGRALDMLARSSLFHVAVPGRDSLTAARRLRAHCRLRRHRRRPDGGARRVDGSIDWLTLPSLDSPTLFGALLDAGRGGSFRCAPEVAYSVTRRYLPATNVLETRFETDGGAATLTDALTLPVVQPAPFRELARRITGVSGRVRLLLGPLAALWLRRRPGRLGWRGNVPVATCGATRSRSAPGTRVEPGSTAGPSGGRVRDPCRGVGACWRSRQPPGTARLPAPRRCRTPAGGHDRLLAGVGGGAPDRRPVERRRAAQRACAEAADLRAVGRHRCGADGLAARGDRRRAELGLSLLLDSRFVVHARRPARLASRTRRRTRSSGGSCTPRGSRIRACACSIASTAAPIRPNARFLSRAIADRGRSASATPPPARPSSTSMATCSRRRGCTSSAGQSIDRDTGRALAEVADFVARIWRQPDSGIWEVRSAPRHFTHSKVMCWVALDRAAEPRREGRPAGQALAIDGSARRRPSWTSSRPGAGRRALGSYIRAAGDGGTGRQPAAPADHALRRRRAARGSREPSTPSASQLGSRRHRRPLPRGGRRRRRGRGVPRLLVLARPGAGAGRAARRRPPGLMDRLVARANDVGLYAEEIDPEDGSVPRELPAGSGAPGARQRRARVRGDDRQSGLAFVTATARSRRSASGGGGSLTPRLGSGAPR